MIMWSLAALLSWQLTQAAANGVITESAGFTVFSEAFAFAVVLVAR